MKEVGFAQALRQRGLGSLPQLGGALQCAAVPTECFTRQRRGAGQCARGCGQLRSGGGRGYMG